MNEQLHKFLQNIGAECKRETFKDNKNHLSGYQYNCWYQYYKHFTIYSTDNGVYLTMTIRKPDNIEELLSELSKTFNTNLDKLKFYEIHFNMFKLQQLPEELINLTSDDDIIHLYFGNYLSIKDKTYLKFNTNKFTILEINDWDLYNKIKGYIDQDMKTVLDKLSTSKPEFRLEGIYNTLSEEKIKTALSFLEKLIPIINRIKRIIIDVEERKIILNDVVLSLENWGVNIPLDILGKILETNTTALIETHEDFWFIKVYRTYLQDITNALSINPVTTIDPKKFSPLFKETKEYYVFDTSNYDHIYQYHIVPSIYLTKYLQINLPKQITDSFEISYNDTNYLIIKGEKDEVHIGTTKTSLRTYLWYFGVKNYNELKNLDKEKITSIINRQINERFFYPMPYDQVRKHVLALIKNTINKINKAINDIRNKTPTFTKTIKNTTSIFCIFDQNCEVGIELDDIENPSSYYSLISTSEGHLPIPIFLEYARIEGTTDEEDISITKNLLYFIRGYEEEIPESEREPPDYIRGASSELFQKAIVLYNKLTQENDYCEKYSLPDGMGYCREFDYWELMQKSEDELAKELIEELEKMKEKMITIRKKILTTGLP